MVKRTLFKYSSVLLCVVMTAANLVACGSGTATNSGSETAVIEEMAAGNTEETITAAISNELAISKTSTLATNTRQETVYVFDDAEGNTSHITVNEKVTDADGNETLNKSESSEDAPVTIKVTYKLDGEEISPDELAGKSGKVTIRFDYTNNEKKTVTVNGKKQEVCVPFTMITGLVLPTDVFSNVEVTNGKLTKVGDEIVAVGMTMPGLSDTLNLKFDGETLDIDIPEYFELTADVENFSLDMTMSVATSNLLSDMDVDDMTLDDLKETMNTMSDAADQLEDGAAALQEGTQQLEDAVPTLVDGVTKLDDGAATLKEGIYAYADGAASAYEGSVSLNEKMSTYADGMSTLYATLEGSGLDTKVAEAAAGAAKLSSYAETFETGIGTLQVGADELVSSLTTGMSDAKTSYETAYNSFYNVAFAITCASNGINSQSATDAQKTAIATALAQNGIAQTADVTSTTQYTTATGYLLQNYSSVLSVVKQSIMAQTLAAGGSIDETTATSQAVTQIVTMTSGLSQAYQAYSICSSSLNSLEEKGFADGIAQLKSGASQFNSGLKTLSTGLSTLNSSVGSFSTYKEGTLCSTLYTLEVSARKLRDEGTAALMSGLSELTDNNDSLKSGAAQIAEGTSTLKSSSVTLSDGVSELNAGAITLKDGMAQFNEEAMEPLSSLIEQDAQTALDTVKAVVKAGQEYTSFLGKSDDKTGSVTFIYKTAGISAE